MRRGEVWWVRFGPSIGGEIRKQRPAIVMTTDVAIPHLNRVQVIPLTTNVSRVYPAEALVEVNGVVHKAMADQVMTVSKERFVGRFGQLSEQDMAGLILGSGCSTRSLALVVAVVRGYRGKRKWGMSHAPFSRP